MPITITVDRSSAPVEVRADMFGANLLGTTNEVDGVPTEQYVEAIDAIGSTRLRYPGGRAVSENIIELDRSESGTEQLREDLRNYLDWIKETGHRTTLVVPALAPEHANQQDVRDWANLVLRYMGDKAEQIVGYEIGNEFWQNIDEKQYGEYAHDIANALSGATFGGYQPEIWVQSSNIVGDGSNYKGGSFGSVSDADAIAAMQHWDRDVRPDDWSDSQTAEEYYKSLNGFEKRIVKGNLELIEQLDADRDITNGFQTDKASGAIDGVIAHYYFDDDVDGYDLSENSSRSELKNLDLRLATWEGMIQTDLDLQITEWNVEIGHWSFLGLRAAGALTEQFHSMVELGVDAADFWTIRHNTASAIAGGNNDAGPVELTPAGVVLSMMTESLHPKNGEMYAVSLSGFDPRELEVNAFTNGYRSVIYVTSHSQEFGKDFVLDLSDLAAVAENWSGRIVGIADGAADGLSDNAAYDENGKLVSRNPRRSIDQNELDELKDVLGNAWDDSLIKVVGGDVKTYLPQPEYILLRPGVKTPTSLSDFYFATETDIAGKITNVSQAELGRNVSSLTATLNPYEVIEIVIEHENIVAGTNSAEVLEGGDGEDAFDGNGGNDYLNGRDGNDNLIGGTGDDTVIGGRNNDNLEGKAGKDRLYGGSGDDRLVGGDGDDYLRDENGRDTFIGGAGNDTASYWGHHYGVYVDLHTGKNNSKDTYSSIENLWGSNEANDTLIGSRGDNLLYGAAGDDRIYGRAGDDTLQGGDGDDYLRDENGRDVFEGGAGQDTVSYWGHKYGVAASLTTGKNTSGDRYESIEHLLGSNIADDRFYGNHIANRLDGAGGNDSLHGYAGNDTLIGGDGTDRLYGGDGNDRLEGGAGDDYLRDDDGKDVFDGGAGFDTASYWGHKSGVTVNLQTGKNSSSDTYVSIEGVVGSQEANDHLTGDSGDNYIRGAAGHDTLIGAGGEDTLRGDAGNDRMSGGAGADVFEFHNGFGRDVITDFALTGAADVLDFSEVTEIKSFSDLMSNHASQNGDDVIISMGSHRITLQDVDLDALNGDHFMF
ncbi:calcium-binding protein [Shimia sp. MMG029]|uniref:calcium-binding protein n=1 Tax=Shimia sp. MMG029 TaxID=3021978 RepID=UPI0022FF0556|nr:calcium-binding protein [Shimia sp. MMG029]MDA5555733.1 calcium-binding protein [Shimia sp. MMG029]